LAQGGITLPDAVLQAAAKLFAEVQSRFAATTQVATPA
ncbi:MAG: hypothetical protein RJA63_4143, partial [Pseudomonadota bacterium]|jgi:hypothetical protein